MSEVVSFVNYQPPQRFDLIPWTEVRIEESSAVLGTYLEIDAIALSPIDADPANPAFRSFTTEQGTALDYWYRVVFADGTGDLSQPSTPIQNTAGADFPTAYVTTAELQYQLRLESPTVIQQEGMQRCLDTSTAEINWDLGWTSAPSPVPALVEQVCLERAVEHWRQSFSPFGVIGIGAESEPVVTARNSWYRHHLKLNAVRDTASQFGIA